MSEGGELDEDTIWGLVISFFVFALAVTIVTFTAVYTHESHLRDLRYDKNEIVACLQKNNTPQECRDMVYGRGN